MMHRATLVRTIGIFALLTCGAAPVAAQVDVQAVRAYLRSGVNSGSEITTPALGQPIYLHVDYLVVGGTAQSTARVRALIDGVEHCAGNIPFDPNSDRVIWCPEEIIAAAGTHTLRWELDTDNSISESNETNNAAEITFTTGATGSRDLEALRAYLATELNGDDEVASPALNQEVYLHVEYRVGGAGPGFMANIEATVDGQNFCSGPITFTPGVDGIIWCPTAWTATAGNHTVAWRLDPGNAISETDESNNTAQVTFTTGATATVDIQTERAYLRTAANGGTEVTQPAVGQQVFVHADYTVTGSTTDYSGQVRALIDDVEHCSGTLELDPDSSPVWCNGAWTATAGTHTLRWVLDANNAIAETDENNNSAVTTFTVGGPALCVGDCDDSGTVVVNELVLGVNIALDRADIEDCPAFDQDNSGTATVNELVSGVDRLLRGCR